MDVERPQQDPGRVADSTIGGPGLAPVIILGAVTALVVGELLTHVRGRRPVAHFPVHRLAV